MSPDHTTNIVALGIMLLMVGLVLTPLMTASNTDITETGELVEDNSTTIDNQINASVENATTTHTNITVRDIDTRVARTSNYSVGETNTNKLPGGDVDVTVTGISTFVAGQPNTPDTQTVTFDISYPRTYHWSDEGILFVGAIDSILALIGFLVMMAVLVRVIFA